MFARGLGAELDVVLSRKLRAPRQPELALGAITRAPIVTTFSPGCSPLEMMTKSLNSCTPDRGPCLQPIRRLS